MSDISAGNHYGVRILSLNGGGARGMFTISVLSEIERILASKHPNQDIKIGDYFDLITGTSIGGILALGLATGKSARELERVFFDRANDIFPKRWSLTNLLRSLCAPIYRSHPLRETIQEMIGAETTFNDLTRRVMIPAVNLSTGKPQFFKTPHNPDFTRDGPLKLIDAALATSAAPTYFSPHYCEDLRAYFADGGLVANNPSYIGLLEVFRDMNSDFSVTHKDIHILNIGTVGEEYSLSPKLLSKTWWNGYCRLWGMGKRLVLTTMTANQHLHKNMLQRELMLHDAVDNYIYLDEIIPNEAASDITLDNATKSSLENLSARGRQLANVKFAQDQKLKNFFTTPAKPFKRMNAQEIH
ncbi:MULTISPECIES: CBASS cGAMP-activated phospholipase [Enterobacter]|uniref:CBASS cGAMP-activated phospholipase n=1 Tax=Enterobacteriaceae TaxID=543 RepID=UPI0020219F6D|nr:MULTISPECIES: CBASS cGAMP-activated phospholipase [Enterobacter]MCL8126312.1 cGAMP-activated phospholipase CapV [Enterobacter hormaechei]MCM7007393.1 cGAMP-activated phospholipase CapV [Enterobacter hormaechei]HDS9724645.1 cGAMP-activated phospholipase CapV [Enterobacter bugandensis]